MRITTKANYSLELRRKAWEIVLTHLKENGIGHGSYLKLMKRTIVSAQKSGTEINDHNGYTLDVESLGKDDLFGFLGGTKNPKNGPRRRISDYKFAIIDAYFNLIQEPMWLEFENADQALQKSLQHFWRPSFPENESFFQNDFRFAHITSSRFLREKILEEKSSGELKKLRITAVRLQPIQREKIFRVLIAELPLDQKFINEDEDVHNKVRIWTDEVETNADGTAIYMGYGVLCNDDRKIEIASIKREVVTRNPVSKSLSLSTPPHIGRNKLWGNRIYHYYVSLGHVPHDPYSLDPESESLSTPGSCMFTDILLERVRRTFESLDRAGSI